MNVYIYKDNQQLGPFNEEQIQEKLSSGDFSKQDFCWQEGWAEWRILESLFPTVPPPPPLNKIINQKKRSKGVKRNISLLTLFLVLIISGLLFYKSRKQKGFTNADIKQKAVPSHNKSVKEKPAVETKAVLSWDETVKKVSKDIEMNDPRAMAIMAYWISLGLQKVDIPKASELANKSSAMGCALGNFSLGCIDYIKTKNADKFRLAYPKVYEMAEGGDPFAQYAVACYYEFGIGDVQRNDDIAAQWLNKSIDQNQLEAIDLGGLILARRYGRPQDGINMYLKAARRGFPHSMRVFSKAWCVGQGFIIPHAESTMWLEKAAEANYGPALYAWGKENYNNKEKMWELIKRGAELNDSRSLVELGYQNISDESQIKDEDKCYSIISKAIECCTFNATYLGADDDDEVIAQKRNIDDHNKKLESDRKNKLELAKREQDKNDLIESIGTKYGKGSDNCYQIVIPKLLSITPGKRSIDPSSLDDKQVILDPLFGMVQRYWADKENLFSQLDYKSYTMGDPIVSHYELTISVGGKLAGTNEITRPDYGFYTSQNKSSISMSEKDVAGFIKAYPIFKKWEKNLGDVNEKSQTTKLIEKPFAFIWNGNSAQLGRINSNQGGDYVAQTYDSNFVDQIKYCIDQIPDMQNLLKNAQSNMRGNIDASSSRIDQLTK